ncbi:MAG TPA: urea carboxylase-associated family protein [Steroidobacteraceae bacterium]|nr:urea carboxylase-associated family protein [Steroidobacteraceae bacterium]
MPPIQEIPARQGRAVRVDGGQALQIINTFGHQVVDFWAFDARNLGAYLSMEHTRAALSRLTPRAGDVLVDNRREPMLKFESDTSPGVHDTVIAPCDPARYAKLGCAEGHASCADNLHRALATLDLAVQVCPASFNLWMNIPVLATGELEWRETVAKPGDSVVFRALIDCIMVMSACPQDVIRINSGRPVSAQYAVLGPAPTAAVRRPRATARASPTSSTRAR